MPTSAPVDVHSQATAYSKLAESTALNSGSVNNEVLTELTDESGLTVLPVSAESAGLLPNQKGANFLSDFTFSTLYCVVLP